MQQTTVAADYRHLHRFDGEQVPEVVTGVQFCAEGHGHEQILAVYRCTRNSCGFPITVPMGPMH